MILKIDSVGNIYIQSPLNKMELSYLQVFSNSVHYDNAGDSLLGLYEVSVLNEDILKKQFSFDSNLDLKRSLDSNYDKENFKSVFFPFFKSPVSFTEKSIKINFCDIKNPDDFLFFIETIAQSLLFYFHHFFSQNSYSKILNKDFFDFFSKHSILGNVYFKLSDYGHMYRLTCSNEHIALFKGVYPVSIKGKYHKINVEESYDIYIKKQLESIYSKLSVIDIKNNCIFEEGGTSFSFTNSDTLNKLIQFHLLHSKFQEKLKNKINKI
jgi:hypothetical protein